jgi:hypothetical protein
VDLVEEVLGRVRREHLRQSGADTLPDESESAAVAPCGVHRELIVAQLAARLRVRVGRDAAWTG